MGSFYPFGLAAGDVGIQKCESISLSTSWTSGYLHTVLYRPLARLDILGPTPSQNAIDAFTAGFHKLYPESSPFFVFTPNTTTSTGIWGHIIWAEG